MASNFQQFDLSYRGSAGALTPLANTTVKVFDATNLADLDDVTSNDEGVVEGGTLPVDAGIVVRFRVENYLGLAMSLEQVTT
ncbi:MAG TPA: hypothetical protein VGC91_08110 [Pyrinomonadaceae bacterium]|jgi:hypothetical protein